MKCEHCGKNEVTFMYRSNINGTVTEKHLCQSCAEELGYTKQLAIHARPRLGGLFGSSFWDDDFFDDFFKPFYALNAPAKEAAPAQEEELMDKTEQERFSRLRRLNALRLEKEQAVHSENYERAAQLRDEIRKLEDMGETA